MLHSMFLGFDFPAKRARERNAIASPFELVQSGRRPMREDIMHHENPRSESGALVAVHLLTRIFGSWTVRLYLPYGLTRMRTWLCASASDATPAAIYRGKSGPAGAASSAPRAISAITQSREQTRLSTPVDGARVRVSGGRRARASSWCLD